MNITKVNTITYRAICIVICLFLLIGGGGMLFINHSYIKGRIGLATAIIIGLLLFNEPSLKSWTAVILTFMLSLYLIGLSGHIIW
ncbi:hypothetical protein [Mucilaginibacter pocheonensis]|uniref:Uncharacterized protein n=1 Tax=Mucilaginibacter pocheonensis TaxID=398050 RepID=A0ABU1TIA5_9SPHI|nr:hypothetical protein [Mucilaginibacter pocheonensis]MDR6945059.1 hypothetical protein [Mucilaginibacter pocheonensis]